MASYTMKNPVRDDHTDAAGTRTATISKVGRGDYVARDERMPAFTGLAKATGGFYVENQGGLSLEEAMRAAKMNYRVEFQDNIEVTEVSTNGVTTTTYPYRGTRALWEGREHEPVGLGMVKSRYQIVQPMEAGHLGQALMMEGGANVVAAGIYGDPAGSQTYLAFKLPEGLTIGGEDRHDLYLTILNSFNGASGLTGLFAPIRLACTNMTTATFGKRANRFTFQHTGSVEDKLDAAREALGVAAEWAKLWEAEAERLLSIPMVGTEIDRFLEKVLPTPKNLKTERAEQRWAKKRFDLKEVITKSETCEFGRGTAYAVKQGADEFADWGLGTKKSGLAGEIARYTRIINGDGNAEAIKLRTAELLRAR